MSRRHTAHFGRITISFNGMRFRAVLNYSTNEPHSRNRIIHYANTPDEAAAMCWLDWKQIERWWLESDEASSVQLTLPEPAF